MANNYAHLGLFQEAKKYAKQYIELAPKGEFVSDTKDLLDVLNIELGELTSDEIFNGEDELIIKQEYACDLLEKGELNEAVDVLKNLIQSYPEFWSAYNNLALAYFYLGNTKKAIQLTEDVLDKNPKNLHAFCNMAVFLQYMGQEHDVNHLIDQLKKVYPIDLDHRYKLGITFALLGKYKEAFNWLYWLKKHHYKGDASYYYWLAISAFHTGNESLAKEVWKTVVTLNPEKKGKEPWNKLDSMQMIHTNHQEWIHLIVSDDVKDHQKYYAFFMLAKEDIEQAEKLFDETINYSNVANDFHTFTSVLLNKSKDHINESEKKIWINSIRVAELLYSKGMKQIKNQTAVNLCQIWFQLLFVLIEKQFNLKNNEAWAAAVEYSSKRQVKLKVTQKQLAEKYDISVSTLQKYIKYLNEVF